MLKSNRTDCACSANIRAAWSEFFRLLMILIGAHGLLFCKLFVLIRLFQKVEHPQPSNSLSAHARLLRLFFLLLFFSSVFIGMPMKEDLVFYRYKSHDFHNFLEKILYTQLHIYANQFLNGNLPHIDELCLSLSE